jgi:hypothetical protein
VIDSGDVEPLMINAVAPTHSLLRVSTTGFVYASADVYEMEARATLRAVAGSEIAQARFREIVEVSPARRLTLGLLTQADFAEGSYFQDPHLSPDFPENHHHFLIPFAGTRGHLVDSRPLLLHRALRAFPGGDLGNLRLFTAESAGERSVYTLGKLYHFRDTFDGLELAHGEPWSISLSLARRRAFPEAPAEVPGGRAPSRT